MLKIHKLFYMLIIVAISSCGSKKMTPEEFMAYCQELNNSDTHQYDIGELSFEVQAYPPRYTAMKKLLKSENAITSENYKSKLGELDDIIEVVFKIKNGSGKGDPLENIAESPIDYQQKLAYVMSEIKNDFQLTDGRDTFYCVMHHLERHYHLSDHHNLNLVFQVKNIDQKKKYHLLYNDRILNTGKIQMQLNPLLFHPDPEIVF